MRRIMPIHGPIDMQTMWRVAVLMFGLAGCQMGGGGATPTDVAAPSAITGPAVEVTSLAPLGSAAPLGAAVPEAAPVAEPKPATAAPVPPAAPVIVKSPSHLACEKSGGSFVVFGRSGTMTCQKPTRDGGKQCKRESDCDGVCLARSNTCAPVKPLLGCQSILQNDGRRVELCID